MSYSWFDLDSAINPKARPEGVKINGMGKVMKVYASESRSTEEFIVGALTSLGESERTLCYVNSSLNGLSERLNLAAKIARPVNAAKARGVEGFSGVPYLNPWEYAIESKVGDFFKKIWDAIKAICRKIVEAITNFIKYIANMISGAMTKSQAKDYDYYVKNKAAIDNAVKAANIGDGTVKSLPWKMNAAEIAKYIQTLASQVTKATSNKAMDKGVLENVTRADIKEIKSTAEFQALFTKIFGSAGTGSTPYEKAASLVKNIEDQIQSEIGSINSGIAASNATRSATNLREKNTARLIVTEKFFGVTNPKVGSVKISEIANMAGAKFDVLSNEWLSANVNKVIASIHKTQKEFVAYTKLVDNVAKKFDKVNAKEGTKVASLSQLTARIARARNTFNNHISTLVIESVFNVFRFRRTCHVVLKAYLKTVKKADKAAGKSGESLQSIESMFNFN